MSSRSRFADRAVALFLLGLVLFGYPVLQILERPGWPLLWLGIFLLWGGFILLLWRLHRRNGDG